ncbi:MAG: TonB-dependent receptor [Hyphomonadaceae bacterium]|nr:TonB-dependent receptor [Hyphomonadaceae bacterium]
MFGSRKGLGARLLGATALATLASISVAPAFAQEGAEAQEEIVVTARRREESLQSVPLSINAFTAETLENAGVQNVEDIATMTPGFTFAPLFGGGASLPVIRGQSTTIGEPNVGFFVDGVYQSSRATMDAMLGDDIARIEVVKGPQSALYGRNTFGGAVNIITSAPSNDLEGRLEASYGEFDTIGLRGSLSGPVAEDSLYFRVGGTYNSSDGYFTNSLTGGALDARETMVLSGMLEARPTNQWTFRLRAAYQNTEDGDDPLRFAVNNSFPTPLQGPPTPAGNQMYTGEVQGSSTFAVTPGHNNTELGSYSLSAEWQGDSLSFTSITGFNDLGLDLAVDGDYSAARANYQTTLTDQYDISQEFRLASSGDGRLSWLAGVYYYKLSADTLVNNAYGADALSIITTTGAAGFGAWRRLIGGGTSDLHEETESFAAFGQLGYDITDRLSVSVEGRWTTETKRADQIAVSGLLNPSGPVTSVFDAESEFDSFVPRVSIEYQATDDILFYATAAQAEKAGGFNTNIVAGSPIPSERFYDPETAWNYEIGAKTSWYDGRLVLNGALYQIDWSDQIVRAIGASGALLNVNAGATSVRGAELEMRARPMDGLEINAGVAYTDSQYDEYTFAILGLIGMNPDLTGTRLQYVSEWQANTSVQYIAPIAANLDWLTRLDVSYQSDQSIVQPAAAYVGDATIVNLRTGLDFDNVSFRIFANNLTEEDSAVTGAFLPDPGAQYDYVRGQLGIGGAPLVGRQLFGGLVTTRTPRVIGASVNLRF